MNSFLKGFCSIFDWMNPRTHQEQMEDLDNQLQDLYDRMGWGVYENPLKTYEIHQEHSRPKIHRRDPARKFN